MKFGCAEIYRELLEYKNKNKKAMLPSQANIFLRGTSYPCFLLPIIEGRIQQYARYDRD